MLPDAIPDYTRCAPFGPSGPDSALTPPVSRPPRLLNMEESVRLLRILNRRVTELGEEGTAFVWLLVDAEGVLKDVRMAHSSGSSSVDRAALELARGMRFSPATFNEMPVCIWFQRPFRFGRKLGMDGIGWHAEKLSCVQSGDDTTLGGEDGLAPMLRMTSLQPGKDPS